MMRKIGAISMTLPHRPLPQLLPQLLSRLRLRLRLHRLKPAALQWVKPAPVEMTTKTGATLMTPLPLAMRVLHPSLPQPRLLLRLRPSLPHRQQLYSVLLLLLHQAVVS